MTNDFESSAPKRISLTWLPWILAIAALALYAITINPWLSFLNIGGAARVAGWSWQPEMAHPVYYLITLPLQLLPPAYAPLGLNLLSAVCAALVIAQLARTVALLPYDRTLEQREREMSDGSVFTGSLSWVPPVIAACIAGLQLTFWEHATNGTTEMIDLLMFSFVGRALMEYRYHGRERWLSRAALVFGMSMAGNAAMVAFFPAFLIALIWIRGISFFNTRFLIRTFCYGLAGLSFYLLLPLITSIQSPEIIGFWDSLKYTILGQKQMILPGKDQISYALPMQRMVLLALPTLVPIILISIRWASYFGDTSQTGQATASAVFHVVHAFFFGVAFWLALDPPFAPRAKGVPYNFLPFYYLAAVCAGYFSGYFLMVFGPRVERRMRRPPTPFLDMLHKVSTVIVLVVLVVTPVALVIRNFREIRLTNGSLLQDYSKQLAANLPKRAVLISDDPVRQFLVQGRLAIEGRDKDYIFLNSAWLTIDYYQRELHRKYGKDWPAPEKVLGKASFTPPMLINQILNISKSNQVFYLHPSFGYYFEVFQPQPRGLTVELKQYGDTQLIADAPSPEVIAKNEAFFKELADTLCIQILPATEFDQVANQYVGAGPFRKVRLRKHQNITSLLIGLQLSRAYNTWGAKQQAMGNLEAAGNWFEFAGRLNRENVVASRNLQYNERLRAGNHLPLPVPRSIEDAFGGGRNWDQVLSNNGPFDDPALCVAQGAVYMQTGLYRQAATCFARVSDLMEDDMPSRLWLAQLHLIARSPDSALNVLKELHASPERFGLDSTNAVDVLSIEASAHFARNDAPTAVALLENAIAAQPKNERLLGTALQLFNQNGRFTNSLNLIEHQLLENPKDLTALLNKGYACIQIEAYDKGIAALNQLLQIETNNASAILNRAIAYLRTDRLTEAKSDYETLVRQYPTTHQLYFGLQEIAFRQKDTNAAIRHIESYLTNAPAGSPEYSSLGERLNVLKGVKPK